MTREEREDAINFFKEVAEREVNNAKYSKLAIEALEQEPCEDLSQRATTCRHGGHCEWVACDKCNHYEPDALSQQPCADWYDVPSDEMTLEQARQAVKDLRKKLAEYLEQEPCEDAISRQAVLNTLDKMDKALDTDRTVESYKKLLTECYKDLPSVTPKEKTGKWIKPQQDDGMSDPIYYQVRCSECGFDLDPQAWHMELHQYGADKFCPNCGARMVSE